MNIIRTTSFCKITEILMGNCIFIIPNFQRPYVWEEKEIEDLLIDLKKASVQGVNGFHYLSAIHVLEIDVNNSDSIIDTDNTDCQSLKCNHLDEIGNPIPIYAVIDGQQRLTTIFLMAHVIAKRNLNGFSKNHLYTHNSVPRLIQSSSSDHEYMAAMLNNYQSDCNQQNAQSAAQKRLKTGLEQIDKWAINNVNAIAFLLAPGLQTSVIQLERNYGLTSFLTLNDRGKQLTVLERLKALILQSVFEAYAGPDLTASANRLHFAFGQIYLTLDRLCHIGLFSKGDDGDQEMVKLLSCYLRLCTDAKSIWQSGNTAYEEYFRCTLSLNPNIQSTIEYWIGGIEAVAEGLNHLNGCLTDSTGTSSIIFPQNSSLVDDYKAIFLSLGLQPHLLALLLRYRVITNKADWHERYPIQATQASAFNIIISDYLQDVSQNANVNHQQVLPYIISLQNSLGNTQPRSQLSMLEAVERLQVLNWNLGSRWQETFIRSCKAILTDGNDPTTIIRYWFQWCGGQNFLHNVLTGWNETNFRYLTREIERSYGKNIHNNGGLQFEHILPQTPDNDQRFIAIGGYNAFGYTDKEEYSNQGVWRSGNLTWLTTSCNASIGNSMPDDKAAHYIACNQHGGDGFSGSSAIKITEKVGNELVCIQQSYGSYRWFISARCAELALFSLGRFI